MLCQLTHSAANRTDAGVNPISGSSQCRVCLCYSYFNFGGNEGNMYKTNQLNFG